MQDFIEVGLDEEILKQFGYEFIEKKYKKFDKYTKDYKTIFKDGLEVTSIDIPSTYEYEGKKYKITSIKHGVFFDCGVLENITMIV